MNGLRSLLRRLSLWLRLAGLLASSSKADTDTMGQWKRLQALPDDPRPDYLHPPPGPHAELIRRVRLYAQNGAKALAPLLDRPLPRLAMEPDLEPEDDEEHLKWLEAGKHLPPLDEDAILNRFDECDALAPNANDREAHRILDELAHAGQQWVVLPIIHAAYNAQWTIVDGEAMEVGF